MKLKYSFSILLILILTGCELENELNDATTSFQSSADGLLDGAYNSLRNYQSQDNLLALTTHTSDEMAGPTRGGDWDDAGVWRVLHTHEWTPTHAYINSVWTTAGSNSFNAQNVICAGAEGTVLAQAIFLRAFNDFITLDNFGLIQRRECGTSFLLPPEKIARELAASQLISEVEAIVDDLPDTGTSIATKSAARVLLMKLYLNKAVYEATGSDGGALAGPYSFAAADMNKVVQLADQVSAAGFSLDENYFDNFIPENSTTSSENIFVSANSSDVAAGNVRAYWFMTTHYNQNPSGWNGFVALSDLYNLFEEEDSRRGSSLPYLAENGSGLNGGFLVGQQFDASGNPLQDRNGNPLAYTPEFDLLEDGNDLEVAGIRAIKYPPDFTTPGDNADNDYVFYRYADVLLMKAEAILRGGSGSPSALDIVNEIRSVRGASALANLDLSELLNERARELYWEGWRRNDQIRFGTFLGTWQEKNATSDASKLLFPIPAQALSTNPNLSQNPGY